MKKWVTISAIICSVISIIACAVLIVEISLIKAHYSILESKHEIVEEYSSFTTKKQNYRIKTYITYLEDMEFICFMVMDDQSGDVLFAPADKWRALDFKGIDFSEDGLDIVVSSGDVGTEIYTYQTEGIWIKKD